MTVLEDASRVVALRPVLPEDEDFLYALYATTRAQEIAGWGWSEEQLQSFFRMQFNAQRQSYRMQFPKAEHNIILYNHCAAGRLFVDRSDAEIRLVDISLLPEYQGKGVGGHLISELISDAAVTGRLVTLQVLKDNPARRLYDRLGFVIVGESDFYYAMESRGSERYD